ncbi:acyl-CoA dehydrogenase family protein [Acrocarpospora catenulata]|uniref:acyl-CoA dehydrogenase family protein n=1 Tax=Acrocarpospora catenulata TaxID=2836182 RepID=UPI001BDB4C61|nr:acyl-CoA dehydrogenase family protein [Acrocarpospora catenulata]
MTSLLYGEVEEELRGAVREVLADKVSPAGVLARVTGAEPYDPGLWKVLARDVGVAGLLVPEELGGAGASAREAAVVLEELGRSVAPVPFFSSAVLATRALSVCDGEVARAVLERLAAGEVTAALVVPWASSPYRALSDISGHARGVVGAEVADILLIPVRDGLAVVDADDPGVTVSPVTSLDLTRRVATVSWSDFSGPVAKCRDIRDVLVFGAGLLASEQLGLAEWCLTSTVSYLKERTQFARPVGSFQALKHRLADLWLEVVGARAAARNAAAHLSASSSFAEISVDARVAVAVAQAHCGAVAVQAAEECIQLHGGIGMTWEHPAHLYLKRAKANEIALGTPADHRDALATLADLPGPA